MIVEIVIGIFIVVEIKSILSAQLVKFLKHPMSSVTLLKNVNKIFIVGMQFTVKTIRNVYLCSLKLLNINMDGIKKT